MEIKFKNVRHVYQPNTPFEFSALNDVSFSIPSGSYVAIIGHTGSGKSTLIQHLNGLLKPTSGEIKVGDFIISPNKKIDQLMKLREKVGMVFQYPEHQLFEENVKKDIAFGPKNFHVPDEIIEQRIPEMLDAVHLPKSILTKSPFDLSGGQMRRVAIAGVLMMDPSVLVLDEPTAGLDPRGQKDIMDMFYRVHKEKGKTTILVTHSMEDALIYADYVIIMDHGKLYMEGEPLEVFQEKEALNKVSLDVPEIVSFLKQFEKKFQVRLPYRGQTLEKLAEQMIESLKGEKTYG